MKDFNELKQLWHVQQEYDGVSYDAILNTVKQTKNKYTTKLLSHVISIAVVVLITFYIFISFRFHTWTTLLSMFIVITCLIYYMVIQIKDYRSIHNSERLLSEPSAYIAYLQTYKQHRYHLNTRNYSVYTICLSVALALYLIEMSFYVSAFALTVFVVAATIWFLICYFVLMKVYIKKESERLEELITKLKKLESQFKD